MESELYDGSIDFYVGPLAEDSASSEFAVEKLFDNHRMVVGQRNHPLARARSLAELADAKWVTTSVTVSSEAELGPVFARFKLPAPSVAVKAQTGLTMLIITAYSDFLCMVPRQWMDFVKTTKLLHQIDVREELVGPSICIVRRARLPLTPVAEHLSDLFRRAATHHMAAKLEARDSWSASPGSNRRPCRALKSSPRKIGSR
jgi:DNA-binding transcriptional LysR family regulator